MTDEPKRIFLGVFTDGIPTVGVIPADALKRANATLDAERAKREKLANEAKTAALRSARNQGKLRKAIRAMFRGHRRIPQ